jgi:tight adherence protein C
VILILLIALGFLGTAVTLALRAISTPRASSAERLSQIEAYGFTAESSTGAPVLAPERPGGLADLISSVGGIVARRIGVLREAGLRNELMSAGLYTMSPRTLLGYRLFGAVLLPLLLIAVGIKSGHTALFILLAILAVAFGWMMPLIIVRRTARMRLDQIDKTLPELIDLLVVTIEAGMGFSAALRLAARELSGPLQSELLLTLQEQSMGLGTEQALTNMLTRGDTPAMRSFVRSTIQGETLGVSTGVIMRNLAVEMRKRRRAAAEEQAQKAPIKMLFPLIFLIFPVLFIVLLGPSLFTIGDAFN